LYSDAVVVEQINPVDAIGDYKMHGYGPIMTVFYEAIVLKPEPLNLSLVPPIMLPENEPIPSGL
jgi:hypothetical protein